MKPFDPNTFWNFISSFFSFLDDKSKSIIENFWEGLNIVSGDMTDKATYFLDSTAPENADTDAKEYYYEIPASPLLSLPLNIDPTNINSKQKILPKSIITAEQTYDENNNIIYHDLIEVEADDYYLLRDVAIDNYVVIIPKDSTIPIKYFKIKMLKSTEEDPSGNRYYPD